MFEELFAEFKANLAEYHWEWWHGRDVLVREVEPSVKWAICARLGWVRLKSKTVFSIRDFRSGWDTAPADTPFQDFENFQCDGAPIDLTGGKCGYQGEQA